MARVQPSRMGILTLVVGLCAASTVCLALISVRIRMTGSDEFTFMRWNLALAWLPMVFALLLTFAWRAHLPRVTAILFAALWLLFLPNAPYLVTDVVHVGTPWASAPLWFDLTMFAAFGATGLLIGYGSLYLVHAVISARFGAAVGWSASSAAMALTGVGIYLGRVLRLNSWDAFTRPDTLAAIVHRRLTNPVGHPELYPLIGIMVLLLMAGYALFYISTRAARNAVTRRSMHGLSR